MGKPPLRYRANSMILTREPLWPEEAFRPGWLHFGQSD